MFLIPVETDEEALLKQALDMSMDQDAPDDSPGDVPNVSSMTEEEQIAYAMQMSLGPSAAGQCLTECATSYKHTTLHWFIPVVSLR